MGDIKQRNEIPDKYKWDICDMYEDAAACEADLDEGMRLAEKFASFEGCFTGSGEKLLEALKCHDQMWMKLEKAFVYSRMKRDEDNRDTKHQAMADKAMSSVARAQALSSFFIPKLLSADEHEIMKMVENTPGLDMYRFMIADTFREKEHILSSREENLLAQLSEALGAPGNVFTMLNNADMKFQRIIGEDGEESDLTHGNYITFMQSKNRDVRRTAYESMYAAYEGLINTIATNYNYNVKANVIGARIRKYPSARAASLSGDAIEPGVYDSLVETVNESLPVLHRYMELRKKLLGVDELRMYDIYAPLIDVPETKISYEEALDMIREALIPMGDEYIAAMNSGFSSGWVDVYESEGKTSGAYSFGSYDSKPYILLNYTDTLNDVFTIIHEMGHSMHSWYTRRNQPFVYGSHSIFTAEVASTVNENLLMKHLIQNERDPEMKKYLIAKHIEDFRTTLFRQTMFAEFEDITHREIESGGALTAHFLCDTYDELNSKYFGPALTHDDIIKYEWARIPHFYNAFYVYKYATGYSAAAAISDIILAEGSKNYIEFLKTGDSDHPIELLKIAGVDMSAPGPVRDAMKVFADLVDELYELTDN